MQVQNEQTPAQALADLRAGAEAGDAEAQSNLGIRYNLGSGVPEDAVEAVAWYRLAGEQGHAYAQYYLGMMYDAGRDVLQDYEADR